MISAWLQWLESIFSWLLTASWQASVLAVLVLLLQWVLRGKLNPRWYHALWLLVVLRLMLPVLPESGLSLFQFAPQLPPALTVPVPTHIPAYSLTGPFPKFSSDHPLPSRPFTLFTLLAVIWLAGALVLIVLTWQVNRRFARQIRNSPAIDDARLLQLVDAAKAELGIRHSLRLVESDRIQGPAIMGLFHPTLILPRRVRTQFTESELRFIFLHELAHLKRGDLIVQALVAFLQILHWFNPVLWFVFRRMRADREPATDALVLSRTGEADKKDYGLVLIKLLEHFNQRHSLPTLVGILEDKDQFKRRFLLIGKFTRSAYGWSLLGILVVGILAVTCLTRSASANASDDSDLVSKVPRNPALSQALLDVVEKPSLDNILNQEGDAQKLGDLLARGADPNAKAKDGKSALTLALRLGKDESAKLLIRYGADLHQADNRGTNSAWMAASNYSCPAALELLIKKGLTVTGWNSGHQATIMYDIIQLDQEPELVGGMVGTDDRIWTDVDNQAYQKRQRRALDLVIAAGADFNGAAAPEMETPLMIAIRTRNYPVAQYLLDHGVDISVKDKYGNTALINLITIEEDETTDLSGCLPILAAILKQGGDANSLAHLRQPLQGDAPWPLLEVALEMVPVHRAKNYDPFREAVELLLDHGAIFPGVPDDKAQALLQAAARCDLAALQKAVESGASVNSADGHGWTPLMITTALNWNAGSEWLIAHGADVGSHGKSVRDYFISPLGFAVASNQADLVNELIVRGAKPQGSLMFESALLFNRPQRILDALLEAGAYPTDQKISPDVDLLFTCIENGQTSIAQSLIEKGAKVEQGRYEDHNLVYWAVFHNRPEILRLLLEHGGNPLLKDVHGETPLSLAQAKHPELVPILEASINRTSHTSYKYEFIPDRFGGRFLVVNGNYFSSGGGLDDVGWPGL